MWTLQAHLATTETVFSNLHFAYNKVAEHGIHGNEPRTNTNSYNMQLLLHGLDFIDNFEDVTISDQ